MKLQRQFLLGSLFSLLITTTSLVFASTVEGDEYMGPMQAPKGPYYSSEHLIYPEHLKKSLAKKSAGQGAVEKEPVVATQSPQQNRPVYNQSQLPYGYYYPSPNRYNNRMMPYPYSGYPQQPYWNR